MRARDRIYHLKCFRCIVCERQLGSGEEFALTPDDNLCCRADLDVIAAVTSSRCTSGKLPADETGSTDDDVIASIDTNVSGKSLNNNNEDELKTNFLTGKLMIKHDKRASNPKLWDIQWGCRQCYVMFVAALSYNSFYYEFLERLQLIQTNIRYIECHCFVNTKYV